MFSIRAATPASGTLLVFLVCLALSAAEWSGGPLRFPIVVSEDVIGANINESDARIAMQAWRDTVAKQSGFLMDFHVSKLPGVVNEIREHKVDGFLLTMLEFLDVAKYASRSILVDEAYSKGGDEYLLLVHDDSAIHTLSDLHGKTLNVFDNRSMCLAAVWLDNLFAASKCGIPRDFMGRIDLQSKLSRVVLPVYFRQADACLVTRRGFGTMCELNPQLGRKLRVLATSPQLVTALVAFHKDCSLERRQKYQSALLELQKTPSGQQTLTMFEYSRLVLADSSILSSALELAKEHDRIRK